MQKKRNNTRVDWSIHLWDSSVEGLWKAYILLVLTYMLFRILAFLEFLWRIPDFPCIPDAIYLLYLQSMNVETDYKGSCELPTPEKFRSSISSDLKWQRQGSVSRVMDKASISLFSLLNNYFAKRKWDQEERPNIVWWISGWESTLELWHPAFYIFFWKAASMS